MRLRPTAFLLVIAALATVLVVPAGASAKVLSPKAAAAAASVKRPVIRRVTPMRLRVGAVLTIRGRNFSSKRRRNTVVFRHSSGRTAFAKPLRASRRKLVVRVPAAAARILSNKASRFRLRVLSNRRFSRFTSRRLSPVLVPGGARGIDGGTGASSCTAGDFDGDLLAGSKELSIRTDPCLADTDGDGSEDGYELQSAIDLNHYTGGASLPYPGKRPYPNALDPTDGFVDYDGDGMSLFDEHLMWQRYSGDGAPRAGHPTTLTALVYSDGLQRSFALAAPVSPVLLNWALDWDDSNTLHDGERDADNDGLGNWDEAHGKMTELWWPANHNGKGEPKESKYPGINFLDNADLPNRDAHADADVDGDGVLDGNDDYDHDGTSNQFEVRRPGDWHSDVLPVTGEQYNPWAYVNPFNPCKPFDSDRCHKYIPFGYYDADEVPITGPAPPGGYPTVHPDTPDGYSPD